MEKIAVLIPCYNEELTIEKVIADWIKELPEATIYVYDNNSNDRTVELAKKYSAKGNVIVRHESKQGKGNVIRTMFREIDADCYIMIDGDDTYPAEYGHLMKDEVIKKGADMVIGDRLSSTYQEENQRAFHNFGNNLVRLLINRLFKNDIKDIMTGYRAFSYRFVKSFPVLSKGFEIETEMTIHAVDKNMNITNTVVDYRDRPIGSESKLNTVSDGIKVLKTIARLFKDYRPFKFFGLIAFGLILIATAFFIPIMISFIKTGVVEKIPTLIVCGFCVITAVISFFSGMILQTLKNMESRRFEFNLQLIDNINKSRKSAD